MKYARRIIISVTDEYLRHLRMNPFEYIKDYVMMEKIIFTHRIYAYKLDSGVHRWCLGGMDTFPLSDKYLDALLDDGWYIYDYELLN